MSNAYSMEANRIIDIVGLKEEVLLARKGCFREGQNKVAKVQPPDYAGLRHGRCSIADLDQFTSLERKEYDIVAALQSFDCTEFRYVNIVHHPYRS